MFQIDLTGLKPGEHRLTLHPTTEDLDLDPDRFSDLEVKVRLEYTGPRALVDLEAAATAQLICDRTLASFAQRIEGNYLVLFAPPSLSDAFEDVYDDVRVLHPSDQALDVTEAVRDTVLLAVPTRAIAPGAEEADIQTVYGQPQGEEDGPIDPRWEALRQLRDADDSDET